MAADVNPSIVSIFAKGLRKPTTENITQRLGSTDTKFHNLKID